MIRWLLFTLPALIVAAPAQGASPFALEIGAAHVAVSGVRPYQAPDLTHSDTSSVTAPYFRFSYEVSDSWQAGVSCSHFRALKGTSSSSCDVFRDLPPGVSCPAVMRDIASSETISEYALEIRQRIPLNGTTSILIGPMLTIHRSTATIEDRTFRDTAFGLGAAVDVRHQLDSHWSLVAGYRYSAPPSRSLSQLFGALAYRF